MKWIELNKTNTEMELGGDEVGGWVYGQCVLVCVRLGGEKMNFVFF